MPTEFRVKRIALGFLALVLALAACEFRFEVDVEDDGSGRFSFLMGVEQQFVSLLEQIGGGRNPFDQLDELKRELPAGFAVERYEARGLQGFRIGIPFRDIDDLKAKLRQFSEGFSQGLEEQLGTSIDLAGGVADVFRNFVLERKEGGGWRFQVDASASGGLDLGGTDVGFDVSQLAQLLDIRLRVVLPGDTVSHNASSAEQKDGKTTFVWKADPTSTENVRLVAETKPAAASFPVVPVAAGGGAAAIAGAAVALSRRRRPAAAGLAPSPPEGEGAPPTDAR